jgi:hypothetical protein
VQYRNVASPMLSQSQRRGVDQNLRSVGYPAPAGVGQVWVPMLKPNKNAADRSDRRRFFVAGDRFELSTSGL